MLFFIKKVDFRKCPEIGNYFRKENNFNGEHELTLRDRFDHNIHISPVCTARSLGVNHALGVEKNAIFFQIFMLKE